ncbi:C-type lectin domain family 9 member A-like isoform 1-T1 [Odontesthes bonariensis]|uniref:C-type lectin domain family 9 member A-like n=1 Tax=Odontesthes bonariensis TaxID=219752 RepID=UPI003F58650B
MTSDIYAQPKKVKYFKKAEEDQAEWEEREVNIYESADNVADSHTNFQSLEGVGPETQNHPAVQKGPFRGTLCIVGVLCIGMLAGTITLSIYSTLKTNRLQAELSDMRENSSQLQDEVKKLMDKIEDIRVNSSQLQDEVKKLKDKIKGTSCSDGWTRFGLNCYNKFTEWKTWSDSRKHCEERGADLVIINSKEEQEFVHKLNRNGESWIGLQVSEGDWKWVDGSPLTEQFWETGQAPTSYYYGVCCNYDGKWKKSNNYDTKNWICEK